MDGGTHASEPSAGRAERCDDVYAILPAAIALALEAVSLTLAILFASYPRLPEFTVTNALPEGLLRAWILAAGVAGVGVVLVSVVYALARGGEGVARAVFLSRVLRPLLLAFAVPLLFNWQVFYERELTCVALASIFALGLERSLRVSFGALGAERFARAADAFERRCPDLVRRGPALVVVAFVVFFAAYFGYHTIHQHYMLKTQSLDMAGQENIVWNLLHGNGFLATPTRTGREGSHLRDHAPFLAPLYAAVYAFRQKADTLLLLQAVVAAAGIIPLFLLARLKLGSAWIALVLAFAYMIHSPLHGPLFYDFEYLTQAPFFVFWIFYFYERGRPVAFGVSLAAALLLREDLAAGLAMASLFLLADGERRRWAFWAVVVSAAYFIAVKFVVMPAFAHGTGESYVNLYRALVPAGMRSFGGVLATVVCNPAYTLDTLLDADKVSYLLKTCAPLLFLPLRGRGTWILLVVPAAFTLLSTGSPALVSTTFQYASYWTAFAFPAVVYALASWKGRPGAGMRRAAAGVAIFVAATALSYQYGAIFQRHSFRGGFRLINFTETAAETQNRSDLYALIAMIPRDADVAATENEAPHLAGRRNCFTMRMGAQGAEFLVLDIEEAGLPSLENPNGKPGLSHEAVRAALRDGAYGLAAAQGRFQLWRRGAPHDRDAEALAAIGFADPSDLDKSAVPDTSL